MYINNINKIKYKSKVCLCTLGKQENRYIREFASYYKKIGVDKIYLYDNNNINDERFEDIIQDFIDFGFIEVINWRGIKTPQLQIMNNCYKNQYKNYNWLLFYDIDEFIYLRDYSNIKDFLNEKKFFHCQLIYLNLIVHTDNNQFYYENESLFERFPEVVPITKPEGKRLEIKFILKGHIPNIKIISEHYCNHELKNCNGFGKHNTNRNIYTKEPDYYYYFIHHFFSKSTEEFINKILRGDGKVNNSRRIFNKIRRYFNQIKINKVKLDYLEKLIGLNLSKYRSKYKK